VFYFNKGQETLEFFGLPRRVAGQLRSESDKIGGEIIFEVWHTFLVRAGCWPEAACYVISCLTFQGVVSGPQATISFLSLLGLAGAEKMATEHNLPSSRSISPFRSSMVNRIWVTFV
jgi:hypothetical protein